MAFNAQKCVVLQCTTLLKTLSYDYFIEDSLLQLVTQHPYLGVLLNNAMSFRNRIENIVTKATRLLNFLCRNGWCKQEVKSMAYTHLVRPMLEYASCVRDPYFDKDINTLEMVQRRAAQWVTSNFDRRSITSTLEDLQWQSLLQRRWISRLKLFHKAVHYSKYYGV